MISAKKNNFIVEYRPTAIRIAQVSAHAAPAVIEDVIEFDPRREEDAANRVRAFAGVKSSAYLQGVCVVYPESRIVRHLILDSGRGKESGYVLDFLKGQAHVNPDEYAVFCLSAQDGVDADLAAFNKKPILVCGARSEEIVDLQNDLVATGVYPNRLEIGSVSCIGVLREIVCGNGGNAPVLYLEIDSTATSAVIVGPKGVEMARRIGEGSDYIAASLKEEMNLKDTLAAEKILQSSDFDLGPLAPKILRKILRELQSSIGFFEVQTGMSVSQLYCTNRGRSLKWLQSSISELLNLSSVDFNLEEWLGQNEVSFSSEEVAAKVDETWIGLLAHLLELKKESAA